MTGTIQARPDRFGLAYYGIVLPQGLLRPQTLRHCCLTGPTHPLVTMCADASAAYLSAYPPAFVAHLSLRQGMNMTMNGRPCRTFPATGCMACQQHSHGCSTVELQTLARTKVTTNLEGGTICKPTSMLRYIPGPVKAFYCRLSPGCNSSSPPWSVSTSLVLPRSASSAGSSRLTCGRCETHRTLMVCCPAAHLRRQRRYHGRALAGRVACLVRYEGTKLNSRLSASARA